MRENGTVRYTLKLRSIGGTAARNVVLCDTMPAGMSFVSGPGSKFNGGRVCWTVGTLVKGKTVTRTITTRVDGAIGAGRLFINRAKAMASNAASVNAQASVAGIGSQKKRQAPVTG